MNVNISSSRLNCEHVARFFCEKMIECKVTPNTSVVISKNDNQPYLESGCNIKINRYNKDFIDKTWPELKKRFNLECSHINFEYDGCINKL
tara:strand:- start:2120 stop:2392 length:273 start_codon:yes stop_codon:yes gene_type:complete